MSRPVLPLLETPLDPAAAHFDALIERLHDGRDELDANVLQHGAVLLRGYAVSNPEQFAEVCALFGDELQDYVGGNTPRHKVHGRVYTSTDYPSHLPIPLHNEMSYAPRWPSRLFFFCHTPPEQDGQTPLADGRAILAAIERIDAGVRERFERHGVMYQQNLHGGWGFGKSWQEAFETEDAATVEAHCREAGIDYEWREQALRLTQVRPATTAHSASGDTVWFNQADQWHVSTHGPKRAERLLATMGETDLPRHAWYGDGAPIPDADLAVVRQAQAEAETVFDWQRGDLLIVDNVQTAHGRRPYRGERRILAAMS